MGLMIGKRSSDRMPVTAKIHQSRLLLQHEHRILKRLEIVNVSFSPEETPSSPTMDPSTLESANTEDALDLESTFGDGMPETSGSGQECTTGSSNPHSEDPKQDVGEAGLVEGEKYFNRIVEDFVDLEQAEMSILIMRRLGPNLLSPFHHRYLGLEETDGYQHPVSHARRPIGSPFPDVYTFLVFCLKAASLLEALQRIDLAHLSLSPLAFHWAPPDSDVVGPSAEDTGTEDCGSTFSRKSSTYLFHDADSTSTGHVSIDSNQYPHIPLVYSPLELCGPSPPDWDINKTKLRLFDFTHSKILSHERARAPSNIFEWQIPGYLEYYLQYLAPEQTGRAETWMDHRTDIYGLGATLFTLLTLQFPNCGNDSVQILQGKQETPCPYEARTTPCRSLMFYDACL